MKAIYESAVGGDGAKAGAYVDGSDILLKVSYPIAKIIEPATKVADGLLDKLEALIPGDWDKAIIEKLKLEYKEELIKLLGE